MTDQTRLAEIRARVEAATPGPWTSKTLHTTLADVTFITRLAECEKELEALRGKVEEAQKWLREDEDNCGNCHYAAQMAVAAANDGLASMPSYAPSCDFHEGAHRFLAALSDNQESPALTDKEA